MSDAVMVPRVPDPNITAVIASMVRRMAIPTSIDPDAIYFDNGHARKIYAAIVAASTPVGGWEPVAWRWRYKGTNWVYGNDLPVWASSDDCDEVIEPLYAAPTPPSVSIDNGSRPQEAVPTAQAEPAVVVWRSPDEVPSVKAGEYAYRIVAVRRAHNGEVYSFGACYLNAVSLWFEDGNESREITGWNSEEGGDEPIYAPLLRDGDDLVGWCEYPIHSAATSQPADGCSSNEGAGE